MNLLAEYNGETDLTINDMSTKTAIRPEDIISTLQYLDMIKVRRNVHVHYHVLSLTTGFSAYGTWGKGVERTTRCLRSARCHCRIYEKGVSAVPLTTCCAIHTSNIQIYDLSLCFETKQEEFSNV
jgi:hypothetical protein